MKALKVLLLCFAALSFSACQPEAEVSDDPSATNEQAAESEPTAAPAADTESEPAAALPSGSTEDQTGLSIQETHPNGTQLIVSAVRFGDTGTSVDMTVINGSEYDISLNRNGGNMMLVDDLENEYPVVPPPDNDDLEVAEGEQLEGSFNFSGRVNPEATSLTLVTSDVGGSQSSKSTRNPEFRIDIPLD